MASEGSSPPPPPSSASPSNGGDDGAVQAASAELASASLDGGASAGKTEEQLKQEEQLKLLQALMATRRDKLPKNASAGHKFWDTQPVPKGAEGKDKNAGDQQIVVGPLDEDKTVDQVRQTPYALPAGYSWCTLDVNDEVQLKEAYTLLTENYVEDDDGMFRFDYSPEFLRWALQPPGYYKEWIVGLRLSSNNQLLAMITGIPVHVHVLDKKIPMAEINFLCVHSKLRSKRLAPVLIKEVTRRVNLENQWQAIYTAGVKIPTPIGIAQYWHRSLNPKKLIGCGFSRLPAKMTMMGVIRLYRTLEKPALKGIQVMEDKHCAGVSKLLQNYLSQHKVWIDFSEEDARHWFLPRKDVVYAYVICNASGEVTDFCSFYNLPSSVLGHATIKNIKAAYSFYNVATSVPLKALMEDALHFANKEEFDVFNALDIMQNKVFLKDLKFGEGDGRLHYYLYNYGLPQITPEEVGVVLL